MPRLKCKLKNIRPHKYSSLWFALKAAQHPNQLNCKENNKRISNQIISHQVFNTFNNNINQSINAVMNNSVNVIEIDSKRALILINKNQFNYELVFGCLRLTLLSHNFTLSLNGFTLLPHKSVEVSAIFGYKVVVKCRIKESIDSIDVEEFNAKLQTFELDSKLKESIETNNCCVVLIEKLNFYQLLYLETIVNFRPSNVKSSVDWFEIQNTGSFCILNTHIWDTLFSELNLSINDRIVCCGGKDVGKSSLIRYLINKYLSESSSEQNSILYLDLDPGQTEFTNSCQLSLIEISKPILCPPFMNSLNFKPLISSSVSSTSPSTNPRLYASIVCFLSDYISKNVSSKGPLFINTMGWTRDLGLALLIDIIRITRPTHIVQIDSTTDHKKNLIIDLTANQLKRYRGLSSESFDGNKPIDYKLTIIESQLTDGRISQSKTNRLLSQLGYLSQMKPLVYKPLFAITPVKILWSEVYIHIVANEYPIIHSLVLDIINSSWVQLCQIDENGANSSAIYQNEGIRVIGSIFENKCLGSGVIKSVDFANKCFYLITPENFQTIASVNCIVRPHGLSIPDTVVLDQLNYSSVSKLPYTSRKQ